MTAGMKFIDFRVRAPLKGSVSPGSSPPPHMRPYADLFPELKNVRILSLAEFIAVLDQHGIERAVIFGSDEQTTFGTKVPNEVIAEAVAGASGRLVGFAGVDPHKGMVAVRELEAAYRNGLRGVALQPYLHRLHANDKKFYPIYTKACELGIAVSLHTSMNYSRHLRMDYGHPLHLDEVAIDFPELPIIAVHSGWPWVLDMIGVARRHPNVYLDISSMAPKYLGMPGTGWEPLLHFMNTLLQDQVLFASSWPTISYDRYLREFMELPLKDHVKAKIAHENGKRLLESIGCSI